jgi:hypothetical protein
MQQLCRRQDITPYRPFKEKGVQMDNQKEIYLNMSEYELIETMKNYVKHNEDRAADILNAAAVKMAVLVANQAAANKEIKNLWDLLGEHGVGR